MGYNKFPIGVNERVNVCVHDALWCTLSNPSLMPTVLQIHSHHVQDKSGTKDEWTNEWINESDTMSKKITILYSILPLVSGHITRIVHSCNRELPQWQCK